MHTGQDHRMEDRTRKHPTHRDDTFSRVEAETANSMLNKRGISSLDPLKDPYNSSKVRNSGLNQHPNLDPREYRNSGMQEQYRTDHRGYHTDKINGFHHHSREHGNNNGSSPNQATSSFGNLGSQSVIDVDATASRHLDHNFQETAKDNERLTWNNQISPGQMLLNSLSFNPDPFSSGLPMPISAKPSIPPSYPKPSALSKIEGVTRATQEDQYAHANVEEFVNKTYPTEPQVSPRRHDTYGQTRWSLPAPVYTPIQPRPSTIAAPSYTQPSRLMTMQ